MKKYETIESAWFDLCMRCQKEGFEYIIDKGSFEKSKRIQLPYVAFMIENTRPLHVTYKGQNITTEQEIMSYFTDYLMSEEISENETYRYGNRLTPHLGKVIEMLYKTPMTNQAVIEVGRPEDTGTIDPPCLRICSWKVVDGKLNLTTFWRSWDCYAGLPVNLGGLTLLNEYVAMMAGIPVGSLVCFSDGLHLYDYQLKAL